MALGYHGHTEIVTKPVDVTTTNVNKFIKIFIHDQSYYCP